MVAVARYQLHNDGAPETVRYAVPVLDESEPSEDRKDPPPEIRLSLDGKPMACAMEPLKDKVELGFPVVRNSGEKDWETTFTVGTGCVVELTIPSGDAELLLEVVEEPLHYSFSTSKDVHAGLSDRRWVWLLSPAGAWSGTVDTLTVDVDLGPLADLATPKDVGWIREGRHARRRLEDVDLSTQAPLEIELAVRDRDRQRVLLQMAGRDDGFELLSVTASSTLEEGGGAYATKHLVDHDRRTAWCEGVPGRGEGEWIEMRYRGRDTTVGRIPVISMQALAIAGYAKSQGVYRSNGRVKPLRVSGCDGAHAHSFEVPDVDDHLAAAWISDLGNPSEQDAGYVPPPISEVLVQQWFEGEPLCVRATIEAVYPGGRHEDTCLSELMFFPNFPG